MYLLGIDLGTTGCKSIIFSAADEIMAEEYIEYALIATPGKYIEQDADCGGSLLSLQHKRF